MDNELFQHVTTEDFIEFGFEPEFIGRLPIRVVCEELSADDLFSIMKYSEGSLLRQYERAFRAYGIESVLKTSPPLNAEAGAKEKTGARGLLTVWEKTVRDFKFYLAGSGLSQLRSRLSSCVNQGLSSIVCLRRGISMRLLPSIIRSTFSQNHFANSTISRSYLSSRPATTGRTRSS